jgi:hypothetical protein
MLHSDDLGLVRLFKEDFFDGIEPIIVGLV